MRIFQFENIHHTLEGQLIEVKTVAHVVIGRYCLRIIIDHDAAPAFLADRIQRLHATPVEFNGRTDAISTGT